MENNMWEPCRDSIDHQIKASKIEVEKASSNAVNSEICNTLMLIVLFFCSGGLLLPFIIYHFAKGSREVKEINHRHPYLNPSISDINDAHNLTDEDKAHFYDHPFDYKIGENKYEVFSPEFDNQRAMECWDFVSRNPRFKNDLGKDEWYNKPYWDIVNSRRERFLDFMWYKYPEFSCKLKQQEMMLKKGVATKKDVEELKARTDELKEIWEQHMAKSFYRSHLNMVGNNENISTDYLNAYINKQNDLYEDKNRQLNCCEHIDYDYYLYNPEDPKRLSFSDCIIDRERGLLFRDFLNNNYNKILRKEI